MVAGQGCFSGLRSGEWMTGLWSDWHLWNLKVAGVETNCQFHWCDVWFESDGLGVMIKLQGWLANKKSKAVAVDGNKHWMADGWHCEDHSINLKVWKHSCMAVLEVFECRRTVLITEERVEAMNRERWNELLTTLGVRGWQQQFVLLLKFLGCTAPVAMLCKQCWLCYWKPQPY